MINPEYRELLHHLGQTVTLSDLIHSRKKDVVALRHDVDHDLGIALDMAAEEYKFGNRKATYCILHTHPYCKENFFIDRLYQLIDYGHEIGLHLDALGSWWRGETEDPFGDLERWLEWLHNAGIKITISATHGAKECYLGNFSNHWMWSDLRGSNPAQSYQGISAEGIHVEDVSKQLQYPENHQIRRSDGKVMDLWSVSMSSLCISYEACTLNHDHYWTDSGGQWKRSPDPMDNNLSVGSHQVLVHPWWWRNVRQSFLILSTARCGTKWLCDRIAIRTSATVLHERSLNQNGSSITPVLGLKRTAGDFVGLIQNERLIKTLTLRSMAGHRASRKDIVEANVYLPHVNQSWLKQDDIQIVHLHRDPALVVRSLLQRGWYNTKDDRSHPTFINGDWLHFNPLEKACTYWAQTNQLLLDQHPNAIKISVEELQQNPSAVDNLIAELGFIVHPLLVAADNHFYQQRDPTTKWRIPPYSHWSRKNKRIFKNICQPVADLLKRDTKYMVQSHQPISLLSCYTLSIRDLLRKYSSIVVSNIQFFANNFSNLKSYAYTIDTLKGCSSGCSWFSFERLFGWHRGHFTKRLIPDLRLSLFPDVIVTGSFKAFIHDAGFVGRLFLVSYDLKGTVIERRPVLRLEVGSKNVASGQFSERFSNLSSSYVFPILFVDNSSDSWEVSNIEVTFKAKRASGYSISSC
ncbi:hypothetical protein [Synechococcus sp. WH 8020]|uniref:hypothetical protein n=1 Tax=Synechococcus sp. (strain WH8020) TaxID=32052 RepID=UPI000AEE4C4F|nr:hypothetical protein [Synechococcus sp. WH 8020]